MEGRRLKDLTSGGMREDAVGINARRRRHHTGI
jgi:hypothetical protein